MRSATEQVYKQRILRVLVHIQVHLDDDLPLEALARIASFSPYHFHSHDNPHVTPQDRLRYDACIATDRPFKPEGEIGTQEIPGGEYAVVTHRGPYEKLPDTYACLYGDWLPRSGREPAESPGFQQHHNSPADTAPEDLVTDIYVPLKPRSRS